MAGRPVGPITQLLGAAAQGDAASANRLWSAVYQELHRLAGAQLAREGPGCSLQATSLVNEAYLRLIGDGQVEWATCRNLSAAAARAVRRICVDGTHRTARPMRGGAQVLPVDEDLLWELYQDPQVQIVPRAEVEEVIVNMVMH